MYLRVFTLMLMLAACSPGAHDAATPPPATPLSADPAAIHYLGEGEFRARGGALAVRAQLELLPGDRYRLLVLEPAMLAMTGVEEGVVERTAQGLILRPGVAAPDPETDPAQQGGSAFQTLRQGSPGRVKTLSTTDNGANYQLQDGGMRLLFTRRDR